MEKLEFERLYTECEIVIKRFVYYKMPSKADGDDVLQEALLAAYQNRGCIRDAKSFKPWLLRIVANKCNDFYRDRAKQVELSLDEVRLASPDEVQLVQSRFGLTVADAVADTLERLGTRDQQILHLFFFENRPQAEIAKLLHIPVGTVKSRLYTAKQRFKSEYPFPPAAKGASMMHKLPESMPRYTIAQSDKTPFPVKWEELMGWFIVPRLGETLSWAMYDFPERKRTESYELKVTGRASVHGISGVEIVAKESCGGGHEGSCEHRDLTRTFIAQLTDTHCRILAESHMEGGIKRFYTFLDADDFLPNWGFGEDNCGNDIHLSPKGIIRRDGNRIVADPQNALLDIVGRYTVTINGKVYDTVCVMDIECYDNGALSEQFLDKNGRTILWRRFNRDDWKIRRYKQRWSEQLPDNERLTIGSETYVHWYDCITDYLLHA